MKLNIKKLDETIEKLTALRRLSTDPALADFVEITGRQVGSNGAASLVAPDGRNGHGSLKPLVFAACLAQTGNFTIKEVYATMQQQGYIPTAESSDKSVANVLRKLAAEGAIKVVLEGSGRRPTAYSNN